MRLEIVKFVIVELAIYTVLHSINIVSCPYCRLIPGEPSVHLDTGTFWTNRAAVYTGKPHRAVFEDRLSKIYKNLYRNASQSGHSGQSTWTQ